MLFYEKQEKFKILSIRIRIHEAHMLFKEEKKKFKFSQFDLQF